MGLLGVGIFTGGMPLAMDEGQSGSTSMTTGEPLRIQDISFQDRALVPIWDKVLEGRRLERDDGLAILETLDITSKVCFDHAGNWWRGRGT